jgi:hypothetical protein
LGIWAAVKVQIMQIQNWGWNSCEDQFSEKKSLIQFFFSCTVFIMTFDETGDLVTPSFGYFPENSNILTNCNFILWGRGS